MMSRPSLQIMNFPRALNWIDLRNTQQHQFLVVIRAGVVEGFAAVWRIKSNELLFLMS